jgi:hypothetical protein
VISRQRLVPKLASGVEPSALKSAVVGSRAPSCGKPNSAQKNRRHEKLAMLAMLAMLLVFPVFFAVFRSKVTLPTIATLAMLLPQKVEK